MLGNRRGAAASRWLSNGREGLEWRRDHAESVEAASASLAGFTVCEDG